MQRGAPLPVVCLKQKQLSPQLRSAMFWALLQITWKSFLSEAHLGWPVS
jgi:hypothetical protein